MKEHRIRGKRCVAILMMCVMVLTMTPLTANAASAPSKCPNCYKKYKIPYTINTTVKYKKSKAYTQRQWQKLSGSYHENYGSKAVGYGTIKVKSIKTEYSAGVSISFEKLISLLPVTMSANYKKTVQTVKGNSIYMTLGAHQYGQLYTGEFYDVYNVTRTETQKCNKCGKVISNKTTKGIAKVPLKQYNNEVTPTKLYVKNMVKRKDKKGKTYWTPNQCLASTYIETIY